MTTAPTIGITTDLQHDRARVRLTYAGALRRAGAIPVLLAPPEDPADARGLAFAHLEVCDALVLTGGDDPSTEPFGERTDPRVTPVHPARQAYETALLRAAHGRDTPTLGVCLGMQMMALVGGGRLEQWMPDRVPTHEEHWDDRVHTVHPEHPSLSEGTVTSHHRQAVADPGAMRVLARAHDGVIEAIDDPTRRFWLGVQWHPERSGAGPLGDDLFARLASA